MSQPPAIPAAQYLRMSTEHQRYSLKNQADAIAAYNRKSTGEKYLIDPNKGV